MHLENMSRRGGGKGSTDSKASDTNQHLWEDQVPVGRKKLVRSNVASLHT